MNELILTIAGVISASGIVGAICAWLGNAFASYINERDKFRDEVSSLKAQNVSQNKTIASLQEQIVAQAVTITDLKATLSSKQSENQDLLDRITTLETTIRGLEATVSKLEATIKELTLDKATAERQRDAALRGDEPETGEQSSADPSAAPADDLGGVSIPKRQGAE